MAAHDRALVGLDAPPDAGFVGIQFAVGTSLRAVAAPSLVDGGIEPPEVTRRGFWLDGGVWEVPRR